MDQSKVNRLNTLFEKMLANNANVVEKRELNNLYREFIDYGREMSQPRTHMQAQYRAYVG